MVTAHRSWRRRRGVDVSGLIQWFKDWWNDEEHKKEMKEFDDNVAKVMSVFDQMEIDLEREFRQEWGIPTGCQRLPEDDESTMVCRYTGEKIMCSDAEGPMDEDKCVGCGVKVNDYIEHRATRGNVEIWDWKPRFGIMGEAGKRHET